MFKCLGRIQDLLNDDRQMGHGLEGSGASSPNSLIRVKMAPDSDAALSPFPGYVQHVPQLGYSDISPPSHLVEIADATFCWKDRDVPVLYVMALSIQPSSFTAIIGP